MRCDGQEPGSWERGGLAGGGDGDAPPPHKAPTGQHGRARKVGVPAWENRERDIPGQNSWNLLAVESSALPLGNECL